MAEAKKDANAVAAAPVAGALGKVAKLAGIAFAVVNLVVMGGGVFLVYSDTLGHHPAVLREPQALEALRKEREESAAKNGEPILFTMEPLTANLGGSRTQMIRVAITLQMLDQDGFEEIVARNPAARDSVVRLLNSKFYPDVESIQGKLFLKDQIALALNGFLKRGVVKDVYFSDFVVQ